MEQRLLNRIWAFIDGLSSADSELVYRTRLFSRLVYLWVLVVVVCVYPISFDLMGPEGYTLRMPMGDGLRKNFVYMLIYSPERFYLVFGLTVVSCILSLFRIGGIISRVGVWLGFLIMSSSLYLVFNASGRLAVNWLFLMIFLFWNPSNSITWLSTRLFMWAARIQFLIVYVISGLFKILDDDWLQGRAVHYLSFVKHFTPEWWASVIQNYPWIGVVLNYVIMAYLLLFPGLIWIKPFKRSLLIVGAGFHLYIAFVMGLYEFGILMLLGYVLFLDIRSLKRLLEPFTRFRERLLAGIRT